MSRIERALTRLENFLAAGTLAAAVVIAIAAILKRAVVGAGIFWSEEAVIFLIIYSTFIGAVITLRHDEHVNVDILPTISGQRVRHIFRFIAAALVLVYCGIIGGYGWLLITKPAARNTTTPALDIPLWVVELALALGLTLMFIRSLQLVYRLARGRQTFPEAEERSLLDQEMPEESLAVTTGAENDSSNETSSGETDERLDRPEER